MKSVLFILVLVGSLLAGCAGLATPVSNTPAATAAATLPAPTAAEKPSAALPAPTQTVAATTAIPTLRPPTPTPGPTQTRMAAVNPATPPALGTPITPDCATFPGFPTCGKGLPLSGRLAVLTGGSASSPPAGGSSQIRVYDFGAKVATAAPAGAGIQKLAWIDQGNYLLGYDPSGKAALVWANPVLSKTAPLPATSPAGTPVISSTDGNMAWIDAKYAFHVRLAKSSAEQVWPAELQPSDKIHDLLGWAPGMNLLLAGYHFADNAMWVTGDRLYSVSALNGKITDLGANLKLGGAFQWHPTQKGLLVFGDSNGAAMMGMARLAVLDVSSVRLTHLIADENVASTYPSWTPDGASILHAASKLGQAPAANDPFALAAIYLTSYPAGTTRRLTQPPAGARDDWPQLLADGKHFLYLRISADGQTVELRLGSLDGSGDAQVASGLTPPAPSPLGTRWESMLAYAP